MPHSRALRSLVVAGSLALAGTTLSATAAVPATALALSPQAAKCADGHSDAAANARVRKGSKKSEPALFSGSGDQYKKLEDTALLPAGSVTIPTYFHVVLPVVEKSNGSTREDTGARTIDANRPRNCQTMSQSPSIGDTIARQLLK